MWSRYLISYLFGRNRTDLLRDKVDGAIPAVRQEMILEELSNALMEMGGKYVLPFCFRKALFVNCMLCYRSD